jgi:polyisoprenoid-binding protein YceI
MVKNLIIIAIAIVVLIAGWWIVTWQEPPTEVQRATVQETTQPSDDATGVESVEVSEETVARIPEEPTKKITITRTAGVVAVTGDTEGVTIDTERSHFTFTGYAIGKSHDGTFETMEATIQMGANGPVGGTLRMDPLTVKTDTAMLDNHLKSPDFFNTAVHKEISFVGTLDAQNATVQGEVTFLGVTKTLVFPVVLSDGALTVDTIINTADFGLENPSANAEVRIQGAVYWSN